MKKRAILRVLSWALPFECGSLLASLLAGEDLVLLHGHRGCEDRSRGHTLPRVLFAHTVHCTWSLTPDQTRMSSLFLSAKSPKDRPRLTFESRGLEKRGGRQWAALMPVSQQFKFGISRRAIFFGLRISLSHVTLRL